jgi:Tol biopolymer transport system component
MRRRAAIAIVTLLGAAGLLWTFDLSSQPAQPKPSPDAGIFAGMGGWIAYGHARGVWAMDPERPDDPQKLVRLTAIPGEPVAWSPDGTKLLVLGSFTTRYGSHGIAHSLSVLNADGTQTPLIPFGRRQRVSGGSFFPDGSTVVFAASLSPRGRPGIFEVDASGGEPRRLLAADRYDSFGGEAFYFDVSNATLSPDGSQIAYIRGLGGVHTSLRVMNADGSEPRIVSRLDVAMVDHLVWLPDGRHLAFDTPSGKHIRVIDIDGSALTELISPGRDPHWSPDGTLISYEDGTLRIANWDGTLREERTYGGSGPWNPSDRGDL